LSVSRFKAVTPAHRMALAKTAQARHGVLHIANRARLVSQFSPDSQHIHVVLVSSPCGGMPMPLAGFHLTPSRQAMTSPAEAPVTQSDLVQPDAGSFELSFEAVPVITPAAPAFGFL
jgi:hypothetical protein